MPSLDLSLTEVDLLKLIRELVERREAALREVEAIDRQLDDVRAALGGVNGSSLIKAAPRQRRAAIWGSSQQNILDALNERQPQSISMLRQRFPRMTTLGFHLGVLAKAGQVVRRKKLDGGKAYWYALSDEAFSADDFAVVGAAQEVAPDPG